MSIFDYAILMHLCCLIILLKSVKIFRSLYEKNYYIQKPDLSNYFFLFILFFLVLVDSNYKSIYAKETIQYDNIYDAYYAKCMEIVTKYGKGTIMTNNSDNSDDYAYLKGLCAVNLIDYDQNHIDDLFLIYTKNDLHTLPDNNEIPFPSSTDYVV